MFFVVIGTLAIVLKLLGVAPVADWSWWIVLAPFGLAVLWWSYADWSGLTKRREMDKLDERKEERRRKAMEALGIEWRRSGKSRRRGESARRSAPSDRIEARRAAAKQRNIDTIAASSRFRPDVTSSQPDEADEKGTGKPDTKPRG